MFACPMTARLCLRLLSVSLVSRSDVSGRRSLRRPELLTHEQGYGVAGLTLSSPTTLEYSLSRSL
jgi:hypothetical protein